MTKPKVSIAVILAALAPYISIGSGLIAAWLFVHFHWLGVFHVGQSGTQEAIYGAVVFGLTSLLTYAAAHFHWLPIILTKLDVHHHGRDVPTTPTGQTGVAPATPRSTGSALTPPDAGGGRSGKVV